jgi:peptidoglycan biosynthesis protein MviN/MurJ (putative lipid II flippase)
LVAGISSTVIGTLVLLIREDFAYLKEVGAGLISGGMGAEAAVWVLDRTLKRYPGRTIAWIYIVITALILAFILFTIIWILMHPTDSPPIGEFIGKMDIFQYFVSIGERVAFYLALIRPKTNFMLD